MDILKQHREVIIGVVLALIVGLSLGYGWGRQTSGAGDMVMSDESVATTATSTGKLLGSNGTAIAGTVAEGNSVTVVDQPAGMNVRIKSVTLSEEGWVAVRDGSGITLGAALFPTGTHTDVSVSLLKPTRAGQSYQALIYFDDGTKTFNLKTESIVLDPDGSVAGATFEAQ